MYANALSSVMGHVQGWNIQMNEVDWSSMKVWKTQRALWQGYWSLRIKGRGGAEPETEDFPRDIRKALLQLPSSWSGGGVGFLGGSREMHQSRLRNTWMGHWSEKGACSFDPRNHKYRSPPLSTGSLSAVTYSQPWSKNIQWKFPEIIHKF